MSPARTERRNLRVSPSDHELFRRAADQVGESVSEFLVVSGRTRAEMILADRTEFAMNSEDWEAFSEALDRPAEVKPAVAELMRHPRPEQVSRFSDPEPLTVHHNVGDFDCGVASMDLWLKRHALQAASSGSARTYVVRDGEQEDRAVGYHALAAASISHTDATPRAAKGMPRHRIPAILLARLAVDMSVRGRGVGAWLLQDAMRRALSVGDQLGVRVLLVHAIDDSARTFYIHHGFEPSQSDAFNLQLMVKDIRASSR